MSSPVGPLNSSTPIPAGQQRAVPNTKPVELRRCSSNACEPHPAAGPQQPVTMDHHHAVPAILASSRALWAGVKTASEGNHYTITHAAPLFETKRSSAIPAAVSPSRSTPAQQPDEDSAGYTTLQPVRNSNSDSQIYYCCTDLMRSPLNHHPVTSLDDPNPLYVNMTTVIHQDSRHQRTHLPVVNPIYPTSPCAGQYQQQRHQHHPSLHVHPHLGRMIYSTHQA